MKNSFIKPFYAVCAGVLLLNGCAAPRSAQVTTAEAPATPAPSTTFAQIGIETAPSPGGVYHRVAPGETLYAISRKYGISVWEIARANSIGNANKIKRGQKLLIPIQRQSPGASGTLSTHIPLYDDRGRWKYIVVHHTATLDGNKKSIDEIHRRRGFGELGYHFVIDNGTLGNANGEIEIGSRWYKQSTGAHAKANQMNEKGIGIALIGNFSAHQASESQINALVHLTKVLMDRYHVPMSRVVRHRDVLGAHTECPGNYFPWKRFRQLLANANA